MKHVLPLLLLFTAACSSGSQPTDGAFSAADTAPDAVEAPPPRENPQKPLTEKERADVALLVDKLSKSPEGAEREQVLQGLVALGPRYLTFLRTIQDDSVALDLMWVIRRIENDAQIDQPAAPGPGERPDAPPPGIGGAGEDRKPPPEYSDLPSDFDREQAERFLGARLRQARRMLDSGDGEGALRVCNAALTLMPDTRYRAEYEALLLKAKNEKQAELLIAGTMQLQPDYLQYASRAKSALFAQELNIKCFLKNVSAAEIRLKLYGGEGRESLLQLSIKYEQLDYFAAADYTVQGDSSVRINAGAEAVVAPGDTHVIDVPVTSLTTLDSDAPRKGALGRLTITARLRVYEAANQEGKSIVLRPVEFPVRTILILPAGFDLAGAAANPINTVRKHLKDNLSQEAFMTALLVKPSQLRAMADLLVGDDLDEDKLANQRARLRAMSLLFDTGAGWDAGKWKRWWQQNRTRY